MRERKNAMTNSMCWKRWLAVAMSAGLWLSQPATVNAALSLAEQQELAQRFRPFIKTTFDDDPEPARPCNWQWFVGRCDLGRWVGPSFQTYVSAAEMAGDPHQLIEIPGSDIRTHGATDPGLELRLVDEQFEHGESWGDVVENGHGIYAHVEEIDATTVNIEYVVVWPFNYATGNDHVGDLTTLIVVYDRGCDLITRVGYFPHGGVNATFRLAEPDVMAFRTLPGLAADHATPLNVLALECRLLGSDQWQDGPFWHSPSDPVVYLVQDPVTARYEHVAVFVEHGAHEFWPNATGSATAAPPHDGNGYSFLPNTVQVFGGFGTKDENPVHEPMLYYNGVFGSDPKALVLHNTWYWPDGRGEPWDVPAERFTDRDPYTLNGPFPWPPLHEFEGQNVTMYVDHGPRSYFNGSVSTPFPDLTVASSRVPAGGTLAVASGGYPGSFTLSRACRVEPSGGVVRLGEP